MTRLQDAQKKFQKELSSGTVSLVLLSILVHSSEPLYGYQIGKLVGAGEDRSDSVMVKQGAVYPVLRSLESQGLLISEREMSDSGPPRRYYRSTALGQQALEDWTATWENTKKFIDDVLGGDYQ